MKELFQQKGAVLIPEIFPIEKCQAFADEMFRLHKANRLGDEGLTGAQYYKNSYGIGSYPMFEAELNPIGNRIADLLGLNLKPKNSYARIYNNGSTLNKHVDRPGLEYTLTVSLYSNLDQPWLFWATTLDGKQNIPYEIPIGDGGFILEQK
jgi:hypothetical protein